MQGARAQAGGHAACHTDNKFLILINKIIILI